jgi:hypothetical protein
MGARRVRASRGTGTVRVRIGRLRAQVSLGTDPSGLRIRRGKTFDSRTQAGAWIATQQLEHGQLTKPVTEDRLEVYLRWWLAVEAPKGKPGRRPLARTRSRTTGWSSSTTSSRSSATARSASSPSASSTRSRAASSLPATPQPPSTGCAGGDRGAEGLEAQLAEAGLHPSKPQAFLGHAHVTATLTYYTAITDVDEAADLLPDLH